MKRPKKQDESANEGLQEEKKLTRRDAIKRIAKAGFVGVAVVLGGCATDWDEQRSNGYSGYSSYAAPYGSFYYYNYSSYYTNYSNYR